MFYIRAMIWPLFNGVIFIAVYGHKMSIQISIMNFHTNKYSNEDFYDALNIFIMSFKVEIMAVHRCVEYLNPHVSYFFISNVGSQIQNTLHVYPCMTKQYFRTPFIKSINLILFLWFYPRS